MLGEIVVTAQKRSESINSVGMSITAATGVQLTELGITTTAQLTKLVPGFTYTETPYATPVYTIRGIGFQENSLAASPAVSIYVDEIPIPFPAETEGAALDVERVEVLKGPQGTLYGQNSTGGAVNYIANKPTDQFEAGVTADYGRFNATDLQSYVSGPLADTLKARFAVRMLGGDDWQKSYTRDDTLGRKRAVQGRLLLDWDPMERLNVLLSMSGWHNRSDSPAAQFIDISPTAPAIPIPPSLSNYPIAPANNRSADWDPGRDYGRDDSFRDASARITYGVSDYVDLISITAYQRYERNLVVDTDGTSFENFEVDGKGRVSTFFQELRLTGELGDRSNWIIGANYERDRTYDGNSLRFAESSGSIVVGLPFEEADVYTRQNINTYAAYGNANVELTPTLSVQGGMRYSETERNFAGCSGDSGNAQASSLVQFLITGLTGNPIPLPPPNACLAIFNNFDFGLVTRTQKEDNVSWRLGVNWEPDDRALLYANMSQGYKSGSFPTLAASSENQYERVVQEGVLAYEAGAKIGLVDIAQLNVAGFYYDYTNKQIRGKVLDPIFGTLEQLVNIPKSEVYGFEIGATVRPMDGLTIVPAVTYVKGRIKGSFSNYTPVGRLEELRNEPFPYTPEWSAIVDTQYGWDVTSNLRATVGGNVLYQSATNGGFGELAEFHIRSYTIIDARASIEPFDERWRAGVYVRNLTDEYYWTSASRIQDTITRYAGVPLTYGVTVSFRFH